MKTIELNEVTLIVTEETAREIEAELNREREERRFHWMIWHWHARRWAMYGGAEDHALFSDMYKDEHGVRPHYTTPEDVFWMLYGRDCRVQHGPWNWR